MDEVVHTCPEDSVRMASSRWGPRGLRQEVRLFFFFSEKNLRSVFIPSVFKAQNVARCLFFWQKVTSLEGWIIKTAEPGSKKSDPCQPALIWSREMRLGCLFCAFTHSCLLLCWHWKFKLSPVSNLGHLPIPNVERWGSWFVAPPGIHSEEEDSSHWKLTD